MLDLAKPGCQRLVRVANFLRGQSDRKTAQVDVIHGVAPKLMAAIEQLFHVVPVQEVHRRMAKSSATDHFDHHIICFADHSGTDEETRGSAELFQHFGRPPAAFQSIIEANCQVRVVDPVLQNPLHRFGVANEPESLSQLAEQGAERGCLVIKYVVKQQELNAG